MNDIMNEQTENEIFEIEIPDQLLVRQQHSRETQEPTQNLLTALMWPFRSAKRRGHHLAGVVRAGE